MPERFPRQEFNNAELELIDRLHSLGQDSPETKVAVSYWHAEQERWAKEQPESGRANLEIDLRLAKIYRAAGFNKVAWDMLLDIQTAARQENARNLFDAADRILDEMEEEKRKQGGDQ